SLSQPTEETANWPFRLAYAARAAHSPVLRDHFRHRASLNRRFFTEQVRRLQQDGQLDQGLDPEDIAGLLQALFNVLGIDVTLDGDLITPERARHLLSVFFDLLTGQPRVE